MPARGSHLTSIFIFHSPQLARFAQLPYDVVIFGHTHVPMVHQANGVTVINPGSCSSRVTRTGGGRTPSSTLKTAVWRSAESCYIEPMCRASSVHPQEMWPR